MLAVLRCNVRIVVPVSGYCSRCRCRHGTIGKPACVRDMNARCCYQSIRKPVGLKSVLHGYVVCCWELSVGRFAWGAFDLLLCSRYLCCTAAGRRCGSVDDCRYCFLGKMMLVSVLPIRVVG